MRDELILRLYSAKELTYETAQEQIAMLSGFRSGIFRPDRCDAAEPIREQFDPARIDLPAQWLSRPSGKFMFKKGRPGHLLGWIDNRIVGPVWFTESAGQEPQLVPPRPLPRFISNWTVYFDGKWVRKIGVEVLKEFAVQSFCITSSDYGLLTTEADYDKKHAVLGSLGTPLGYVGVDPEVAIPGLYWITMFSDSLSNWLGVSSKMTPRTTSIPCGVLLETTESPDSCQSFEARNFQRELIQSLGDERFFDIHRKNRELKRPRYL